MLSLNFCKKVPPLIYKSNLKLIVRGYVKSRIMKIAIVGASGDVGRPLSLLLKQSPLIDELAVYDINDTCGFATELGHVDTRCKVVPYSGVENIAAALQDSKIVVVTASSMRSSFLPYSKMLESNGEILRDVIYKYVEYSPNALLAVATKPINSTLPLVCKILQSKGILNPQTVFGITTLDLIRANSFAAELLGVEPECVFVPVIGGSTEKTIVPVYSQTKPCSDFSKDELEILTADVQNAHNAILKAKQNQSATLSNAFAISRFVISLVKALCCHSNIVECAYVMSDKHRDVKYLSTPLLLGPRGIQKNLGIPRLTEYEICLFDNAVCNLAQDIKEGELFFKNYPL